MTPVWLRCCGGHEKDGEWRTLGRGGRLRTGQSQEVFQGGISAGPEDGRGFPAQRCSRQNIPGGGNSNPNVSSPNRGHHVRGSERSPHGWSVPRTRRSPLLRQARCGHPLRSPGPAAGMRRDSSQMSSPQRGQHHEGPCGPQ